MLFLFMNDKKFTVSKYIVVLFITTIIFIAGIFVGNYFSDVKLRNIEDMERAFRVQTMAIELQYDFLSQNPCESLDITPLTDELHELSNRLSHMENTLGLNNPTVIRLKEYYSLLGLKQWLFLKRANEECGKNNTLILYFYSNEGDCATCEQQGNVLTYIRRKYPHVMVYPLDINIHNPALDTIQKTYLDKTKTPILVINDEVHYGFKNRAALEKLI